MNELDKTILIATGGHVEVKFLTDDREANSRMLMDICDQMRNGSWVAFGLKYYSPYLLFEFVCDVNNKFPNLIALDDVYGHVEQYWEWYDEVFRKNVEELVRNSVKKSK